MLQRLGWIMLVIFLAGCAHLPSSVEPLQVSVADVSVLDIGLIEQRIGLKVRLQNPNRTDVSVDGMRYDLDLNGQPFAHGVARPQALVPAYGEVVIEVEAVSNLASILRQLAELQKTQKLDYRLRGEIDSGKWQGALPFDREGTISLPDFGATPKSRPGTL